MSKEDIKQAIEFGIFKNILHKLPKKGTASYEEEIKQEMDVLGVTPPNQDKYEVIEYWEDDRVITIIEDIIARDTENPYWHKRKPYITVRYIPIEYTIWGIGIPEIIKDLQKILNDLSNDRLNQIRLFVNTILFYNTTLVPDPDEIISKPGKKIPVNGDPRAAIFPFHPPEITAGAFQEKVKETIKETTGAYDVVRGTHSATSPQQTAAEVYHLMQQANTRFKFIARTMVEEGIKKIAKHFIELSKQFLTDTITVKVREKDTFHFVNISPDSIDGNYDFIIKVEPHELTMAAKRQAISNLLSIASNPMFQNLINPKELLKEFMDAWEIYNPKIIVEENYETTNVPYPPRPETPSGMENYGGVYENPATESPTVTSNLPYMGNTIP